jgi:hypothetical protein
MSLYNQNDAIHRQILEDLKRMDPKAIKTLEAVYQQGAQARSKPGLTIGHAAVPAGLSGPVGNMGSTGAAGMTVGPAPWNQSANPAANFTPTMHGDLSLISMLRSRMRWTHDPSFEGLFVLRAGKDGNVLVMVVLEHKHVVLEDGYDLYPSDALITQLRLLGK